MSLLFDLVKGVKGEDTSKVHEQVAEMRLNICKSCPLYSKHITGVCGMIGVEGCGCIVKDKVKYRGESCPHNKWTQA